MAIAKPAAPLRIETNSHPAPSTTPILPASRPAQAPAASQQTRQTSQRVKRCFIDYCAAGAGLPKSTLGAVEIAFSFSTAKLGLVW